MTVRIKYIKYHHSYKYELFQRAAPIQTDLTQFDISLPYIRLKNGKLIIQAGYKWNGPSGPAIDTKNFMRGSLIHDAIYQLLRMQKLPSVYQIRVLNEQGELVDTIKQHNTRKYADELLRDLCREDGMSWLRSRWVYRAVRMFAARSAKTGSQGKKHIVLTAP